MEKQINFRNIAKSTDHVEKYLIKCCPKLNFLQKPHWVGAYVNLPQ